MDRLHQFKGINAGNNQDRLAERTLDEFMEAWPVPERKPALADRTGDKIPLTPGECWR